MKKILILLLLIIGMTSLKVNAFTNTGHDEFLEITFNDSKKKLLTNMSYTERNVANQYVDKSRFWGWKTHYYNLQTPCTFVGEVMFCRYNNTSNDVKFTISLKETKTTKQSISVSDKLSVKGSGGKKINLSLANDLSIDYSKEESTVIVESLDYSLIVPKGKKLTMYTMGEAVVTSGCSAYYAFWIRNKKGYWEIIDIKTIYYQLTEENI